MDVNEHERLSSITLRPTLKKRNHTFIAVFFTWNGKPYLCTYKCTYQNIVKMQIIQCFTDVSIILYSKWPVVFHYLSKFSNSAPILSHLYAFYSHVENLHDHILPLRGAYKSPNQESVQSCIFVLGVSILSLFLRCSDCILELF